MPPHVEVIPKKGRVGPDDNKDLKVVFYSKEAILVEGFIGFQIRAGKIIRLPIRANCIVPDVKIVEDIFDFGNVITLGNTN